MTQPTPSAPVTSDLPAVARSGGVGSAESEPPIGLEDVVAAVSRISHIDGVRGALVLAGRPVLEAARAGFAAGVAAVREVRPDGLSVDPPAVRAALGRARVMAARQLARPRREQDTMGALRTALAQGLPEGPSDVAASGLLAVALAAHVRRTHGRAPIAPDADLPHAADVLRMLGLDHGDAAARALDVYLATVLDHGLNASTFAARVVASTGADDEGALLAGIAALAGPLHGGAPGPVLDMLDAIGRPDRAEAWITSELDAGRRIMGLGHRVYRVRDPRAAALEEAAGALATRRLELARRVEEVAVRLLERRKGRSLRANVELWTAVLLDALGIDRRAFTGVFAVSRAVGWAAHAAEQRAYGRLLRPRLRYLG